MSCRSYNIFISSTFKDMDAERDVIKYYVIPRLNDRYRKYGMEFHAIDLRFGINTENMSEEDSENAVLDVCLSMIDSSRPFFIALIGERYGWIPQADRMSSILSRLSQEKRKLVMDGLGCSVTELEILYGAIGCDGENIGRSLFFIRDPKSYDGISKELMSTYVDGFNKQLNSLKTKILNILQLKGKNDAYIPYSIMWDEQNKCFKALDSFGTLVFERLCDEIDAELSELSKPLPWYEYAMRMNDFITQRNCDNAADLYDVGLAVKMIDNYHKILISGRAGTGKSVLLAQIYSKLQSKKDVFPLISLVPVSPYAKTLNSILYLLILELEKGLSLEYTPDSVLYKTDAYKILHDRFYELIDTFKENGTQVVCLVDGIECISKNDNAIADLLWVRPDLTFICTCLSDSSICSHLRNNISKEFSLDTVRFNVKGLVACNENRYGIMLPERLEHMLELDGCSPMHVKLFMTMVSNLSVVDFNKIRALTSESEIDKINRYIIDLYKSLPKELSHCFYSAVSFLSDRMNAPWLKNAVLYIASSRTGLRKVDIEKMVGSAWNELVFTVFMNMFDTFFSENQISKLWTLNSHTLVEELSSKTYIQSLCRTVSSYPDNDLLKCNFLAYYTILASESTIAEQYLCTDDIYKKEGKKAFWSEESINHIYNETESLNCFSDILKDMSPVSQLRMVYILTTSIPLLSRAPLLIKHAPSLLGYEIYLERTDDLYALASILNDTVLRIKHISTCTDLYDKFVDGTCSAYKKCYQKDSTYADVRNMYKVAMMTKAESLCERADFDGAMRIYQSINQI